MLRHLHRSRCIRAKLFSESYAFLKFLVSNVSLGKYNRGNRGEAIVGYMLMPHKKYE
jgi:hypothetical protein